MLVLFIILCINNRYLQKLRLLYQKEQGRECLSIDKLSPYRFTHFPKNYSHFDGNNDEWNDSILSRPSDILCRNSIQSDNFNAETINLSNRSFTNTSYEEESKDYYDFNADVNYSNINISKPYTIPISVMEKNLNFDVTLLERDFNEDIKTKLCSTRKRHHGDDIYESQNDSI
ncbi:Hypothetical protein SRAE_2000233900 [Strongyloides ratti]|uniref:Uncharacterized protein n=1 Tax=Strongyloides ratti TaxID=34506 RepID=A0A090LHQ1_STRRB|nr:Hypothetical protein SRAE_2000233900 [Strongyloides ratti]CEF67678.1 Hypothetical protein SRAE_2000233900 [Strongyloides ratti]